jgi:transaldolase
MTNTGSRMLDRGWAGLPGRPRQRPFLTLAASMLGSNDTMQNPLAQLKIRIFADGADKKGMLDLYANPLIRGLTTNPSLMRKAGVTHYEAYAREILQTIKDKPISFEVFSDEFPEMKRQALKSAAWQKNVYVKIPITNTRRESSVPLIRELAREGVQVNVTAILTLSQVRVVAEALDPAVPSVVSVFAGRIADTGRDPEPLMRAARALLENQPAAELLWASVREVLNLWQAEACGCHIVTVPHDILAKALKLGGLELAELSLDTVKMFAADAASAGYTL